ncbi:hypothetical protein ABEB33_10605 [Herbaspirillum huttiense]|uniref:hypothetical protein n=1 Tax=Herbaspirillum huttiense TaxID=863372 RepID=UPI001416FDCD|nr:hypothetical protein [Herbaspirillum huttiense]
MLLPSKDLLNGAKTPATTTAEMRVALGQLRDYLADLIGEDSDDKVGARAKLGVINTILPPGMRGEFYANAAPTGWLKANGAVIQVGLYGSLATAIYCGDALNATALWGYRCTNPANPSGSRSTVGAYIVLPDARGEYSRGWDDGRGVDSGRSLWGWQDGQLVSHNHGVNDPTHSHGVSDSGHAHSIPYGVMTNGSAAVLQDSGAWSGPIVGAITSRETTGIGIFGSGTGISIQASGGAENRVRNLAALVCIKY